MNKYWNACKIRDIQIETILSYFSPMKLAKNKKERIL